ncbi:MAG: CvpA family protein [Brevinematia bacterium]
MNILDVITISVVLLGLIWGARKGFIGVIILVIGIIVTIVVVDAFGVPLSSFFTKIGVDENLSYGVAVLSILVVCFVVFFTIHLLLKNLVDMFRIGWINRILGAILGGWVLFVFLGSLLFFFSKIPLINFKKYINSSAIAKYSHLHAKDIMSLSGSEERIEKFIEGEE